MSGKHPDHPYGSEDPQRACGHEQPGGSRAAQLGIAVERLDDARADPFTKVPRSSFATHRRYLTERQGLWLRALRENGRSCCKRRRSQALERSRGHFLDCIGGFAELSRDLRVVGAFTLRADEDVSFLGREAVE